MSFDFPASPTQGQEYTPFANGPSYVWNAPRWLVKGTPIVAIPGTKEEFDEVLTDGDFVFVGDPIDAGTIIGTMAEFDAAATDGDFVFQNHNADLGPTVRTGYGAGAGADAMLELGGLRTGNGYAVLDLHTTQGSDYEFRIARSPGVNGGVSIVNTGTGSFQITQANAGEITFATSNARCFTLNSAGAASFQGPYVTINPLTQAGVLALEGVGFADAQSFQIRQSITGVTNGGMSIRNTTTGINNIAIHPNGEVGINVGAGHADGALTVGGSNTARVNLQTAKAKSAVQHVLVDNGANPPYYVITGGTDGSPSINVHYSYFQNHNWGNGGGTVTMSLDGSGNLYTDGNHSMPGGKMILGINSPETFSFHGMNVPQYGMMWNAADDTSGNVVCNISGWSGVRIYSSSNEQVRITSLGLSTFANVSAGGRLESNINHGGGGLVLSYNSASTGSRAWWLANDYNAYGDLMIATNATQTGTINVPRIYINAIGEVFTYGQTLRTNYPGIGNIGLRASGPNNAGYIEFFRADTAGGTRAGYLGNCAYEGGDIQYANEAGGGHSFNSTIYTPRVAVNGQRPITLDSTGGAIFIKGDPGGWGLGLGFVGSAGTYKGGFGAVGGADALSYYWVGTDYNSPATSTRFFPDGGVQVGNYVQANNSFTAKTSGYGGITIRQAGTAANSGYMEFLAGDGARVGYIGFADIAAGGILRYNNEQGGAHTFIGGPVVPNAGIIMPDSGSNIVKDVNTGSLNLSGGTAIGNGGTIVLRGSTQTYHPYCVEISAFNRERIRVADHPVMIGWDTSHIDQMVGSGLLRVASDFTESNYCICATAPGQSGMYALQCVVNGSHVGGVSCSATATQYNTSSDVRLKKNIADATVDSGPLIDQIRVREFDWIEDDTHVIHGTIAQELVEVYPVAVTMPWMDDPNSFAGVDYSKLVPMLILEIQKLRARVSVLEG